MYQWGIVLLATSLNLIDGFDVLALAFTATAIKASYSLDGAQLGYLLSAGIIGMTAGSLLLAPLADFIGRRWLLILSLVLSTVGMLASGFAKEVYTLGIGRVITGLGVGGVLVGTNVIVSEYVSDKWRSFAISVYASGFGIGALLGGIFAVSLQGSYGWHSVFLAGAILTAFCLLAVVLWMPESSAFLQLKTTNKAKDVVSHLSHRENSLQRSLPIKRLLTAPYRNATLALWSAFVAIMFSYYFVSSWTPALLKEAGMTTEQSVSVGMMISLGGTLGSLLFGLLASKWQARHVLAVFMAGSALVASIFIAASASLWISIMLGILIGALMNGCISGLYAINPTIYQTEIRSTGVGMAIGVGRIGAVVAPIMAGFLLDAGWEKQSLYIGVAIILLMTTLVIGNLKTPTEI